MQQEKWIDLPRSVAWSYVTRPRVGRCRIDGAEMTVSLTLSSVRAARVPDVLDVEAWLRALLETATTVEEVAIAASKAWQPLHAAVEGETRTHGVIRAECWGES